VIQARLTISDPGDQYEQEADRVAEEVMRMPDPSVTGPTVTGRESSGVRIQRVCPECEEELHRQPMDEEEEEETLQAKEAPGQIPEATQGVEAQINTLRGGGQPLPESVRAFFEPRFGYDFSQVRMHTDALAARSARAVNALAYTVGRDVVFGAGQYAPGTEAGGRLLAHELTHVVQQRSATMNGGLPAGMVLAGMAAPERLPERESPRTVGRPSGSVPALQRQAPARPARNNPYSITTSGCATAPYVKADVEAAALAAFTAVKDTNCIKSEQLKESILDQFDGLNIDCENSSGQCGMASRYFTQTVNLYHDALNAATCGALESTVLHEVIHLTERAVFGHGDLAGACEKACFGSGSGDASKCTFEQGFVPVFGGSFGAAFSSEGAPTWQAHLYLGLEKRGPVLGIFHPSLGIGLGLIGETTTGQPGAVPTGTSALFSVLGGLRVDPGQPGGGYVSLFGGPSLAVRDGQRQLGAEAGFGIGYRWRWLDLSVDAGYDYDPTREAGINDYFTLGASIRFGPSVQR
jgi:hypothetical protein